MISRLSKNEVNAPLANNMKTALFTNFTDQEFIGYWDGKGKTFKRGQSLYMPDYLARHFAKDLTNRELLKTNKNGQLVYKDGEKMTSPKKPEDSPIFMEIFNKAYTPDEGDEMGNGEKKKDDIDMLIDVANKNRGKKVKIASDDDDDAKPSSKNKSGKQDPKKPQVILPPDFDEDEDDDDESSFKGKPVEKEKS